MTKYDSFGFSAYLVIDIYFERGNELFLQLNNETGQMEFLLYTFRAYRFISGAYWNLIPVVEKSRKS